MTEDQLRKAAAQWYAVTAHNVIEACVMALAGHDAPLTPTAD